jgi:hypothetical protein
MKDAYESVFLTEYLIKFIFEFSEYKGVVSVGFVDIGGIVDHHCLTNCALHLFCVNIPPIYSINLPFLPMQQNKRMIKLTPFGGKNTRLLIICL